MDFLSRYYVFYQSFPQPSEGNYEEGHHQRLGLACGICDHALSRGRRRVEPPPLVVMRGVDELSTRISVLYMSRFKTWEHALSFSYKKFVQRQAGSPAQNTLSEPVFICLTRLAKH